MSNEKDKLEPPRSSYTLLPTRLQDWITRATTESIVSDFEEDSDMCVPFLYELWRYRRIDLIQSLGCSINFLPVTEDPDYYELAPELHDGLIGCGIVLGRDIPGDHEQTMKHIRSFVFDSLYNLLTSKSENFGVQVIEEYIEMYSESCIGEIQKRVRDYLCAVN